MAPKQKLSEIKEYQKLNNQMVVTIITMGLKINFFFFLVFLNWTENDETVLLSSLTKENISLYIITIQWLTEKKKNIWTSGSCYMAQNKYTRLSDTQLRWTLAYIFVIYKKNSKIWTKLIFFFFSETTIFWY